MLLQYWSRRVFQCTYSNVIAPSVHAAAAASNAAAVVTTNDIGASVAAEDALYVNDLLLSRSLYIRSVFEWLAQT